MLGVDCEHNERTNSKPEAIGPPATPSTADNKNQNNVIKAVLCVLSTLALTFNQ